MRATEHHLVLSPRIQAAVVGATVVKVVARAVGDGVTPRTGKDHIVTLFGADAVSVANQRDIPAVQHFLVGHILVVDRIHTN